MAGFKYLQESFLSSLIFAPVIHHFSPLRILVQAMQGMEVFFLTYLGISKGLCSLGRVLGKPTDIGT